MRAAIRRIGNSSGIVLPKPVLARLRLTAGDLVELDFQESRIVLSAVPRSPREGWAEAAKALAAAGDDAAVWPLFGNAGDEALCS